MPAAVLGDRQAGLAVGGDVDDVAVLLEEAPQCSAQALVILDDEEMHRSTPATRYSGAVDGRAGCHRATGAGPPDRTPTSRA